MKEDKKITLEEYQDKYTKPENAKLVKTILFVLAASIGIVVATLLTLLVLRLFDINKYAGYIGIGVAVLIFIVAYLIPVIKISRMKYFITNVNHKTLKSAKKHNRELRNQIADMMIEYNASVEGASWYNEKLVNALAIARKNDDNEEIKNLLNEIYTGDVKKQSNTYIRNTAMKVGVLTALSQSERLDTLLVVSYELVMIKNIIYLYGFRPSNAKLLRIYLAVLRNALISYGASNVSTNLLTSVSNAVAEALGARHALGHLISNIVGSATAGVINGTMSVIIGFQTRKYLLKEYHLQNILDNIDVTDEEEKELMSEVKTDIIKNAKKRKLAEQPA